MAAVAAITLGTSERGRRRIDEEADVRRDPDIRCRLPGRDLHPGPLQEVEHLAALRIVDGSEIDARSQLRLCSSERPERGRVTLDDLCDAVADRLQPMVARCETVARLAEA